ncbi:hypothetical protein CVS40_9281 [Lucilia cuprina]|nr:hypothetical protein CVS40_9281 [Lucilia cuprina]
MNGVHPLANNRFRELASETGVNKRTKIKRPRSEDFVPLPEPNVNDQYRPRYLVASTRQITENTEVSPLLSYNVFQVERGLNFISRERMNVTAMKSGDLLIKVADNKIAEKFLRASFIDTIPVKITLHKTLNTIHGRIYSRKIINISEQELSECLRDQKVIEVRKITRKEKTSILLQVLLF